MSAYHEMFLRPLTGGADDAEVARELGEVLGVELEPVTTGYGATYRGAVGQTVVEVLPSHDLVDDGGLLFESHPIEVDFRDLDKDEKREREVARKAFDGLVRTGKYSLFATYNTQVLIDSKVVEG